MFTSHPDLLSGVGRDVTVEDTEKYVCLLYGIDENAVKDIDHARHSLFVKAKHDLEMLPPTHDTLELHIARANYQAKIWLQADKALTDHENNKPTDTIGWRAGVEGIEVVWKRLPAVQDACMELVTCGCKTKCATVRCKCCKACLKCTPACKCDAIDCANPTSYDV